MVERLLGDKCFAPPDWLLESRLVLLPKVEGKATLLNIGLLQS